MAQSKNVDLDSESADIIVHAPEGEPGQPVLSVIVDSVSKTVVGYLITVNGIGQQSHTIETFK
ncbi:hypothetical protein [Pseudomonas quasicaspiana]|uniref:hypothetical protein n=1 Tax=Pseudomonas quasicaspiana TaxID=2829821 RepID=UPI001E33A2E5|nr:hypothetical protein [Pseudomonas quasicaspiana]MCD5972747.1 hypothetical protein [Pseudomonas quasicaspiana]